jgi:DNA-binding MarR family transcriptional regulator
MWIALYATSLDSIARARRPTMGELAASLVLDRSALAYNIKPLE